MVVFGRVSCCRTRGSGGRELYIVRISIKTDSVVLGRTRATFFIVIVAGLHSMTNRRLPSEEFGEISIVDGPHDDQQPTSRACSGYKLGRVLRVCVATVASR